MTQRGRLLDDAQPAQFAAAHTKEANFDPQTSTLTMNVDVTNSGNAPMTLKGFTTSSLTFVDQTAAAVMLQAWLDGHR